MTRPDLDAPGRVRARAARSPRAPERPGVIRCSAVAALLIAIHGIDSWAAGLPRDSGAGTPADSAATAPASTGAVPFDSLTVERAIELARAHAPDVLTAAALHGAARFDSMAAGFNRRAALSVAGGATVAPHGFYDPVITNLGDYDLKLVAELPVLDGGARARERARAALGVTSAAADLAAARRDAGQRAALVALDELRQQDNERAQSAALEWIDRLASIVASAVRAGARGQADAMRVTLERSNVELALLTTRQTRAALARELVELTGSPGPVAVRTPAPAADTPPVAADSTRLIERLAASPAVRQAEAEAALQRVALDESRRRNAIQLGLTADAGLAGSDLTAAVPEDFRVTHPGATFADRLRRDLGASAAVRFKQPLLDRSVPAAVAARRDALRAALLRRDAAMARGVREAQDRLDAWRTAARRTRAAAIAAAQAQENLLRLRSLYAGGGTGLLDLLDARRRLDDAFEQLGSASFDARVAHYQAEIP